ncbi:MAG: threonylcarbamoyl-AMP synthase [Rhodospirillaceae bacterium]|nr:threonylcarbamoyl-AMP synthase [Rhodospirillaceae bacterium]
MNRTRTALANETSIAEAAALLRAGELVAFATETVYGLGADATNGEAVARIFEAKRRPSFNPLISHLADAEAAFALGQFTGAAKRLAMEFWPGPLTIVVARSETCPIAELACAGLDTVALRVPAHPIARQLLVATGRPVAAPSANRSGRISPTRAEHVASELGSEVAMILDGGACEIGLESTVVDATGERPVLLRPGSVTAEMLEAAVGPLGTRAEGAAINSPGLLHSHYAPGLPVRLEAGAPLPGEAYLGFGGLLGGGEIALDLSPSRDLREAAANLFAMLRALDRPDLSGIAVAPIPMSGLGSAINDRLRRAAAPR